MVAGRSQHRPGAAGAPAPLAELLLEVSDQLASVLSGKSATVSIATVPQGLRPATQALLFAVLRRWGLAQALLRRLATRPPAAPVRHLLGSALALLGDGTVQGMYTDHTLVDQAVAAARGRRSSSAQAGFINACLRRYLRERQALLADCQSEAQARWNLPEWWIDRLRADHPERWESIADAARTPPPLTLRVNRRRIDRDAWLQKAERVGIEARACGADGVVLRQALPVLELPGFEGGEVSVQDLAAQHAAPLLLSGLAQQPAQRRLRILDACAAPGGKTAHLLEMADADVVALDIDSARCARTTNTLSRLEFSAEVLVGDAAQPLNWWDGRAFDAILLDAPCTASGIVRRHPDIAWLRRPADVETLAGLQMRLMQALWPLLATGGRLLYCTCSVFRSEGAQQVTTFLARNTDARLLPSPGHLLPFSGSVSDAVPDNSQCGHDGFFYALFEKAAAG